MTHPLFELLCAFEDGHMEVTRFKGDESIAGGKDLELIRTEK